MSLESQRIAIETFFLETWVYTPMAMIGQKHELPYEVTGVVAPYVALGLQNGQPRQGTIGRVKNVVNHYGILTATIYTDGGLGQGPANDLAQKLMDLVANPALSLTSAGRRISGPGQTLVRFCPPELDSTKEPFIASMRTDAPHLVTVINAPFVRYDLR